MSPRPDGLQRTPDGDLVEADDGERCPYVCAGGWIGHPDAPRPCPHCRPDAAQRLAAQRSRHTPDWTPGDRP